MKILIIGGTGFIGKNLIPKLLNNDITILSRSFRNLYGLKHIQFDRDKDDFENKRIENNFDIIIDLIAFDQKHTIDTFSYFKNLNNYYIHISSVAVYKNFFQKYNGEEDDIGGGIIWGKYGKNKSDCDQYLLDQKSSSISILRPSYIFGEHNHIPRESFIFSKILNNNTIYISNNDKIKVQFTDVQLLTDVISYIANVKWVPGPLNIANVEEINFFSWITMLSKICKTEPKIIFLDNKKNIINDTYYTDGSTISNIINI